MGLVLVSLVEGSPVPVEQNAQPDYSHHWVLWWMKPQLVQLPVVVVVAAAVVAVVAEPLLHCVVEMQDWER